MRRARSFIAAALAALCVAGAGAQALRPEIGRPLQQAGELLKAGKAREALARVREAEAVANQSPAEQLTVARMKAAAAQRAGDNAAAAQALEALAAHQSGVELGQTAGQIAATYAQMRNTAKTQDWVDRATQAGNNGAEIRQLQNWLRSASGDYGAIARDAAAAVAAAEQAGRKPEEADLLRLADAQQRSGNAAGRLATVNKLLLDYPKKEYWSAALAGLQRSSGFSDRYALDLMRLRLASTTLSQTEDFMEMAQLALQARLPAEALGVLDQGYRQGALGSGPGAPRQQRLKDLAARQLAEQKQALPAQTAEAQKLAGGDELVRVGYAWVTLGQDAQGIALIGQGLAKGRLDHPEEARLRLGMAQLHSAATRTAGLATLRSIHGGDGAAELARLWLIAPNP